MKTILFSIILLLTLSVNAQKDPEAEQLLKKAANKALSYKTIHTQFEFIVKDATEGTTDTYAGELWIKGKKYKMSLDNTITFCDGKTRWVYLTEANEVNVSNIENIDDLDPEERFLNEPLSIYTLYKKGFKYIISGTQNIDNKEYTIIDLAPEDLDKPYFKIKCWISNTTSDYYAIKYFQKDGTRITLQLKNFTTNKKLKDDLFSFDSDNYPDVEIIDLRE